MNRVPVTAFEDFDRLVDLFGRTRRVLDDLLRRGQIAPETSSVLADETLPHIEGVEAGFRARLRASEGSLEELRALVLQGGLGVPAPSDRAEVRAALIEAMRALSGAGGPRTLVQAAGRDLAALGHAQISMAVLPLTDAADVRFPGRPSYSDIVVPRGPAEFAARIEEVERVVWRAATGAPGHRSDAALRRVYAFFDAGERLAGGGYATA